MSILSSPLSFISTVTLNSRFSPRRSSTRIFYPTRKVRVQPFIFHLFLSPSSNRRNHFCCSSVTFLHDSSSTPSYQDFLIYSRSYWLSKFLIAWDVNFGDGSFFLCASRSANLFSTANGIEGTDVKVKLEKDDAGLPAYVIEKFPFVKDYRALKVPQSLDFKALLKCQLAVASFDIDGKFSNATGLQLPGIMDELFSYNGPLGTIFSKHDVSLYLWAPTAQTVIAHIYDKPSADDPFEVVRLEEKNGVWSAKGPKSWEGLYFAYEVCVYHPSTLKIEKCIVNDPYARGLSSDGKRTLLVDLGSDALKPKCWDNLAKEKPVLQTFTDASIYELHVRDFSASDDSVHPDFRGSYLAFTSEDSDGVRHLKNLCEAGLTHVHLLPTFHFAGVDDEKEKWKVADNQILETFPSCSPEQQAIITSIADEDGYNWGYNPVLWGVPKGSYASNPDGPCRTIEFRKMVQALNRIGFRVVLDVVYNHLFGNGPFDESSVLDKIVPGYYVRRNADGFIEHSACANNTASEHFMVERLILDDLLCWAVHYKVDGFRFDIMGHLMKHTMLKAKTALRNLSIEKNGVCGSDIYIYGEGWDFGEVAKNGRGVNASQFNLYGTGIGSFNDRIRDAILGGSPFGHPLQQGFVTGLLLQPNGHDHGSKAVAEHALATLKDHIQIGMAGNLRDFWMINCDGKKVRGSEVLTYDNSSVAYASCPSETVNYVSAHDNETLFDIVSLKTPMVLSAGDRCRINYLANSIIAFSQGIPFFHAGDEMLRSKSLDRDSYNSGDWFNRLDFSFESNNWGVGLPPKEKNEKNWPLIKPRLADPSFKPETTHILSAVENFLDLIRIRYSSPLFHLPTAKSIQERVRFHNTGPSSVPGVIAMSIEDGVPGLTQLDPIYSFVIIIINVDPNEIVFATSDLRARNLQLHPIQLKSSDESVKKSRYDAALGSFLIPPRTTSVFVEPRNI